jgi:hypothetical protein
MFKIILPPMGNPQSEPFTTTVVSTKRTAREAGFTLEHNVKRLAEHDILKSGDIGFTFHSNDDTFVIKLIKEKVRGSILINDTIEKEIQLNTLCRLIRSVDHINIMKFKSDLFATTIHNSRILFIQKGSRLIIRFISDTELLKYMFDIYISKYNNSIKLCTHIKNPEQGDNLSVYKLINYKDRFNLLSMIYILSKEHRNKITAYSLPFIDTSYLTAIPSELLYIIFNYSFSN